MAVLIRCNGKNLEINPKNSSNFTKIEVEEILGTSFLKIDKASQRKSIIYDDRPSGDEHFLNQKAMSLLESNGKNAQVWGDCIYLKDTEIYFS